MTVDTNNLLTYIAIATSIGSVVLGIINHKQIRSRCCGRSASVSLDIDSTTPTTQEPMLKGSDTKNTP